MVEIEFAIKKAAQRAAFFMAKKMTILMMFFLGKGLAKYPFTHEKPKGNNANSASNNSKFKDGRNVTEIG
jgi:hypothetical protein